MLHGMGRAVVARENGEWPWVCVSFLNADIMVHQCLTVGVLPARLQQGANTLHSQAIIYTTGWTKRLASMSQPTYPSWGYTQPMFVYGVLPQIASKFLLRNQGQYSFPTAVGHGFSSPRPQCQDVPLRGDDWITERVTISQSAHFLSMPLQTRPTPPNFSIISTGHWCWTFPILLPPTLILSSNTSYSPSMRKPRRSSWTCLPKEILLQGLSPSGL